MFSGIVLDSHLILTFSQYSWSETLLVGNKPPTSSKKTPCRYMYNTIGIDSVSTMAGYTRYVVRSQTYFTTEDRPTNVTALRGNLWNVGKKWEY